MEERDGGRTSEERGSVFSSETATVLIGINLRLCVNAKTRTSGICGVLFFASVKAFHLLAFTNQILQGELLQE